MRFAIRAISCLALLAALGPAARAEHMTAAEAQLFAQNHVRLMVADRDWTPAVAPEVGAVQPFTSDGRQVGWLCPIKPRGFVVLSLFKEVNPLKAYSCESDLDPNANGGLTRLLKDDLARDLRRVTKLLGHAPQPQERLDALVQFDQRTAFDQLTAKTFDASRAAQPRESRSGAGMDYREGQVLLTSRWHQFPPFNNDCPDMGCSYPSEFYWNENAVVGCVATAGAQILRHWRYAAGLSANWPAMCNYYDPDKYFTNFDTEFGTASATQMAAVAYLSHVVGLMVDMDYGCPADGENGSGANTADMEDVFEDLGYSENCEVQDYDDFDTAVDWFNAMKNQLNLNRPMQMGIGGHSIVVDGWKTNASNYYYHLNYGWRSENSNTWYSLNNLNEPGDDDPTNDFIVTKVVPAISSGSELNSTDYAADGYRYWDRDPIAWDTVFHSGNQIQILRSGCYLQCVGSSGQSIRFYGSSGHYTRMFLYGDPVGSTRVLIKSGGVKIHPGAGIAIY